MLAVSRTEVSHTQVRTICKARCGYGVRMRGARVPNGLACHNHSVGALCKTDERSNVRHNDHGFRFLSPCLRVPTRALGRLLRPTRFPSQERSKIEILNLRSSSLRAADWALLLHLLKLLLGLFIHVLHQVRHTEDQSARHKCHKDHWALEESQDVNYLMVSAPAPV